MRDRFTRGVIAGLAGAAVKDVVDLVSRYVLRYSKDTFLDENAIMILGRRPQVWEDWVLAEIGELLLAITIGLLFVYLISRLWSSRRLLLKSSLFSLGAWYFLYAAKTLFKVTGLTKIATETVVIHALSTLLFGLAMGLALRYMNRADEA